MARVRDLAVTQHWALDVSYADFGEFESVPILVGLPFGGIVEGGRARLGVEAWSVAASYRRPLGGGWYAGLRAGVSRASFDMRGALTFPDPFVTVPTPVDAVPAPVPPAGAGIEIGVAPFAPAAVPFERPDDATGWLWGVEVGWQFAPNWGAALAYRQHELDVLEIESVGIELRWSF